MLRIKIRVFLPLDIHIQDTESGNLYHRFDINLPKEFVCRQRIMERALR